MAGGKAARAMSRPSDETLPVICSSPCGSSCVRLQHDRPPCRRRTDGPSRGSVLGGAAAAAAAVSFAVLGPRLRSRRLLKLQSPPRHRCPMERATNMGAASSIESCWFYKAQSEKATARRRERRKDVDRMKLKNAQRKRSEAKSTSLSIRYL